MTQRQIWDIRKRIQRAVKIDKDSHCSACGRRKGHKKNFLHRHHIVPVVELSFEEACDPGNIVVLCFRCHAEVEGQRANGIVAWARAAD